VDIYNMGKSSAIIALSVATAAALILAAGGIALIS
jgi:hypothetical protein